MPTITRRETHAIPDEASSFSSLPISHSSDPENWAQLFLLPLIKDAEKQQESQGLWRTQVQLGGDWVYRRNRNITTYNSLLFVFDRKKLNSNLFLMKTI